MRAIFRFLQTLNILFAGLITFLWFFFIPLRRSLAFKNIKTKLSFGRLQTISVLLRSNFSFFLTLGESIIFWAMPLQFKESIQGLPLPEELNKGAIIYVLHLGGFYHLIKLFSICGYKGHFMVKPVKNPLIGMLANKLNSHGNAVPVTNGNNMLPILKSLKNGGLLGVAGDQHFPSKTAVYVNFLAEPASYSDVPLRLSIKYQRPVYLFNLVRRSPYGFQLIFDKISDGVNLTEDPSASVLQEWSDIFEKWVRKYPDQWFWLHKRWKKRNY